MLSEQVKLIQHEHDRLALCTTCQSITTECQLQHCRSHCAPTAQTMVKLECGPMPNLMVALPNIGGALCSTLQSLADAHYYSAVQ